VYSPWVALEERKRKSPAMHIPGHLQAGRRPDKGNVIERHLSPPAEKNQSVKKENGERSATRPHGGKLHLQALKDR